MGTPEGVRTPRRTLRGLPTPQRAHPMCHRYPTPRRLPPADTKQRSPPARPQQSDIAPRRQAWTLPDHRTLSRESQTLSRENKGWQSPDGVPPPPPPFRCGSRNSRPGWGPGVWLLGCSGRGVSSGFRSAGVLVAVSSLVGFRLQSQGLGQGLFCQVWSGSDKIRFDALPVRWRLGGLTWGDYREWRRGFAKVGLSRAQTRPPPVCK